MGFSNRLKGEEPGFFASIPHMRKGKGHYGEWLTEYALNHKNLPGRLKTYTNLLVPRAGKATGTSEVDVLMLHEQGIFVFESKNYSGWIFGSADQHQWTMSLNARTKERFYNPIMQNRGHVQALVSHLGLPESAFVSYIVFSERCELKKVPDNCAEFHICRRHNLVRDLKRDLANRPVVLDEAAFAQVEAKLDALLTASTQEAKDQHVEQAKLVANGKVCPYCGSPLVERKRKSDGGTFVGCSGFPKCRYTRREW
ncbi:MAG: NERD domain-containing protein [Coriobacteriia bacterium]|nr:NERD domain-containing protein [Coriobacteriia bacterium]